MCYKYNYALDKEVQHLGSYNAFFYLSNANSYLNIINRKPNSETKYVLEADKELIKNAMLKESLY